MALMGNVGKLVVVGLIVAAFFGYRSYKKGSTRTSTLQKLEQTCQGDAGCMASLSEHFESCFDEHYRLGGRRRRAKGLNEPAMLTCINSRSGKAHFAVDTK
jgi:hypothetical protein